MIYNLLLRTREPIVDPDMRLSTVIGHRKSPPFKDICSAILSTCPMAYDEASWILYQNVFVFSDPSHISAFQGNMLQEPELVDKREWRRTQRITKLGLLFAMRFHSEFETPGSHQARSAKWWCDSVVGIFRDTNRTSRYHEPFSVFESEAASSFRNVEELELGFCIWTWSRDGQFPPHLLTKIYGNLGWKVKKITILGLYHHMDIKETIERALSLSSTRTQNAYEMQPQFEYEIDDESEGWSINQGLLHTES